jgi:hypothetical protein
MGGIGGGLGAGFGATGGATAGGAGGAGGVAGGTGGGFGLTAGSAGSTGFGLTAGSGLTPAASSIYGVGAGAGTTGAGFGIAAPTTSASLGGVGAGVGGGAGAGTNIFGQVLGQPGVLSNTALGLTAGTSALAGATQAERDQFGIPSSTTYSGPLNKFKYDPDKFTPSDPTFAPGSVYRPTYAAEGGIMNLAVGGMVDPRLGMAARQQADEQPQGLETLMARGGTAGNKDMAAIDAYVAAAQGGDMGSVMAKAQAGDYNAMVALNKVRKTPNQNYAAGGHLGGYSDGGRMLKGPGDGMSDNIPATIAGKQPARLADGEFVVPADVVSHLGNGSTDAGAKQLYAMMNRVRKARTGNQKQGKQIKPAKYMAA